MFTNGNTSSRILISEMSRGCSFTKVKLKSLAASTFYDRLLYVLLWCFAMYFLKKNQNAPRPSEHPPVRGEKMSKRLHGIKDCKYKTSSWHLNGFPDGNNIGSTV